MSLINRVLEFRPLSFFVFLFVLFIGVKGLYTKRESSLCQGYMQTKCATQIFWHILLTAKTALPYSF